MIQLLGIGESAAVELREKFSITQKQIGDKLQGILNICGGAVILSTCNRVELYFISVREDEEFLSELFKILGWDFHMKNHLFHMKGREAVQHLMEVSCGLHSKILGEEQILGQIKNAFDTSLNHKAVDKEIHRLFQNAITCGKEFRYKSELNKIPVSSSSISVNIAWEKGARSFMILGFGEVGQLTLKYIQSRSYSNVYAAVRDIDKVNDEEGSIKFIPFSDRKSYYNKVDCIISCTSAPHTIINKEDLPEKNLIIFDLAVPRDVHASVYTMENVEVYNIDSLGVIDNENRKKRENIMLANRYILDKYLEDYMIWCQEREITGYIEKIKKYGENVYKDRYNTFKNKMHTKDNQELAETLLKSTSNAFVNRAIEVLKEENRKGSGDECLRIIEKLFSQGS